MDSVVVVSSRPRWKTVHAPNRTRETARERERGGGGREKIRVVGGLSTIIRRMAC